MKFILAPDKFKNSLTGLEFCHAAEKGILSAMPTAKIVKLPLADGGDGTIEILAYHLDGEEVCVTVNDPLFRPIQASYLYISSKQIAFIEMAEASGMKLLKSEDQNCYSTTTLGTGELILDATKRGAKTIVLGIGGSATNDCGLGMASALGYKFEDKEGKELLPIGKNLSQVIKINTSKVIPELKTIDFKVACDVKNPLYGPNGAAYVYGTQKGASEKEIELLDEGLKQIAQVIFETFKNDVQNIEGAGAAGGMGAGAFAFLNAELQSGISLVKDMVDFDNQIKDANWIITGEGKLDEQTLSGKTIQGILTSAKNNDILVAALCGSVSLGDNNLGITYIDSVVKRAHNIEDAMANSYNYVREMARDFAEKVR